MIHSRDHKTITSQSVYIYLRMNKNAVLSSEEIKRMNTCVFQSNKTRLSHYTCSSDTTDGNRNTNTQRIKETESISTHRIHV